MANMSRPKSIKPRASVRETIKSQPTTAETKHLSMRIDADLHRRLHIQARQEDRTASSIIVELVTSYLEEKGSVS